MEKMKELYEKVAKDSALQAKFSEIMKDAEKAGAEATEKKLMAFVKEEGYDISIDEMQAFFKELSEQKDGALSDMELDMVAGGKTKEGSFMVFGSVVTYGVTCALMSAGAQLEDNKTCSDYFR